MRNSVIVFLMVGWLAGCGASVRTMDVSSVPTYTIESINTSPKESMNKLKTAYKEGAVVLLKKGDKVPVQLRASFGPVALQSEQNFLFFSQDTYLYIGSTGVFLSPDGNHWAPIQDTGALSKVFGLKQKGTFQFGLGVPEGKPASFTIALEKH